MSKAPPIPPEQRAFAGQKPDVEGEETDRRDVRTETRSSQPGDADVNTEQQGRFANTSQNLKPQWRVQDR